MNFISKKHGKEMRKRGYVRDMLREMIEDIDSGRDDLGAETTNAEGGIDESSLYTFKSNPEESDFSKALDMQIQEIQKASYNLNTSVKSLAKMIDSVDELRDVLPGNSSWGRFRSVLKSNSSSLVKIYRVLEKHLKYL